VTSLLATRSPATARSISPTVPGWISHVELAWAEPTQARYLEQLAASSRLILIDKRGTVL
jgi:hypothetical protein